MFKSILGGIFISIGATAFLVSKNPITFLIGIFLVFNFRMGLITGYFPLSIYNKRISIKETIIIIIGNTIGAYLSGLIISYTRIADNIVPVAKELINYKTNDNLLSIFLLGILCCALIGYGIIGTLKSESYLGKNFAIMFPTYIFVILGAEHIVANVFYVALANGFDIIPTLPLISVTLLGNLVGGYIVGITSRKFI